MQFGEFWFSSRDTVRLHLRRCKRAALAWPPPVPASGAGRTGEHRRHQRSDPVDAVTTNKGARRQRMLRAGVQQCVLQRNIHQPDEFRVRLRHWQPQAAGENIEPGFALGAIHMVVDVSSTGQNLLALIHE